MFYISHSCVINISFFLSKSLHQPAKQNLPDSDIEAPYVIVANEGFSLRTYLSRPFPRKQLVEGGEKDNFNYRLARARMVVECSYGSLLSKFNILSFPIATDINNTVHIIKAITLLHNTIKDRDVATFTNHQRDPVTATDTSKKLNSAKNVQRKTWSRPGDEKGWCSE